MEADRFRPEQAAFLQRLQNGKCAHAYLIEGARGMGKRMFASWCAQALLCTEADVQRVPCGVCPGCRKVTQGFHPDLHWYGDGEKAITVGDVRSLIRETELVPSDGDRSVYILCHAEKMQPAAQNALLKVFEEPPAGVVIFLLTESRRALLPTIRSRGQLISLPRMQEDELLEQIRRKFPRESEEQRLSAVRSAQGSPGEAEAFFEKGALSDRKCVKAWLDALLGGDKYLFVSALTVPKYKREGLLSLLDVLIQMLFDLLLTKSGCRPVLLSDEEAGRLGAKVTRKALSCMCEAAVSAREGAESNGNLTATVTALANQLWLYASGSGANLHDRKD